MKNLLRCLLLLSMPVLAYGADRKIERITVLRPATGTEVHEAVRQITWSDGVEQVILTPHRNAPAAEYDFDLATGTYKSKITPVDRRAKMKAAANTGRTHEVCDPFDEQSCTPSEPETTMGTYYTYGSKDDHGVTMASLGVMPCRGTEEGRFRLDYATPNCMAGLGFTVSQCTPDSVVRGRISATPSFGVTAGYTGSTQCGQRVELFMGADGIVSHVISGYPGHSLSVVRRDPVQYFASPCGTVITETGGGGEDTDPPDDPDLPEEEPGEEEEPGGDPICATVYDGQTGAYLGTCCGTTLEKIIKCAMEIK